MKKVSLSQRLQFAVLNAICESIMYPNSYFRLFLMLSYFSAFLYLSTSPYR